MAALTSSRIIKSNMIHVIGFLRKLCALYHAITRVPFPISHSLCAQVMIGKITRNVSSLKKNSNAIRLRIFSFNSQIGLSTPFSQLISPLKKPIF